MGLEGSPLPERLLVAFVFCALSTPLIEDLVGFASVVLVSELVAQARRDLRPDSVVAVRVNGEQRFPDVAHLQAVDREVGETHCTLVKLASVGPVVGLLRINLGCVGGVERLPGCPCRDDCGELLALELHRTVGGLTEHVGLPVSLEVERDSKPLGDVCDQTLVDFDIAREHRDDDPQPG